MDRSELARHFDHTCLRADAGAADIAALCEEAIREGCATVCVNPRRVEQADGLVTGSAVSVCTVIGFPLGATTPKAKACEAERARRDGATEFDMVMDLGGFLDGRHASVRSDIQTVRDVTTGMVLKVILETALLDPVQIRAACLLAVDAGADFVKTSTGFGPAGASLEAVRIMREAVGEAAAVKASGGIRDLESVLAFLAAGAVRIGSSSTVTILDELGGTP